LVDWWIDEKAVFERESLFSVLMKSKLVQVLFACGIYLYTFVESNLIQEPHEILGVP
jgi:hypothetical protein